jgi:hypothetical protein
LNGGGVPLAGGNVSGGVVRVGDTVRRPAGFWTPAVHALLKHLHEAGFRGAPDFLAASAAAGREPWTRLWRLGHGQVWLGDTEFIEQRLPLWEAAVLD